MDPECEAPVQTPRHFIYAFSNAIISKYDQNFEEVHCCYQWSIIITFYFAEAVLRALTACGFLQSVSAKLEIQFSLFVLL